MASNLDYLASDLEPLEEKVKAYLQAEKALRTAYQTGVSEPRRSPGPRVITSAGVEQRLAMDSFERADERQQRALREDLDRLRQEIMELLPARDAWVKVNLGYGPSRVGAWSVPGPPAGYELRVVH